jgi:hypothetical protein
MKKRAPASKSAELWWIRPDTFIPSNKCCACTSRHQSGRNSLTFPVPDVEPSSSTTPLCSTKLQCKLSLSCRGKCTFTMRVPLPLYSEHALLLAVLESCSNSSHVWLHGEKVVEPSVSCKTLSVSLYSY